MNSLLKSRVIRVGSSLVALFCLDSWTNAQVKKPVSDIEIEVSESLQTDYGIETQPLASAMRERSEEFLAEVVDPLIFLGQARDLTLARIQSDLDKRDWERTRKMADAGQLASEQAVEAAEAKYALSNEQSARAKETIILSWGDRLASADPEDLASIRSSLVTGSLRLIRLRMPLGQAQPSELERVEAWLIGRSQEALESKDVWSAPRASEQGAPSFFALVPQGEKAWPSGLRLKGNLMRSSEPIVGLRIPSSALVYEKGQSWVYQKDGDTRFERHLLINPEWSEGDWFVRSDALSPDLPLVVSGAQALLSQEILSNAGPTEDD